MRSPPGKTIILFAREQLRPANSWKTSFRHLKKSLTLLSDALVSSANLLCYTKIRRGLPYRIRCAVCLASTAIVYPDALWVS
jgi:hypothetical protein